MRRSLCRTGVMFRYCVLLTVIMCVDCVSAQQSNTVDKESKIRNRTMLCDSTQNPCVIDCCTNNITGDFCGELDRKSSDTTTHLIVLIHKVYYQNLTDVADTIGDGHLYNNFTIKVTCPIDISVISFPSLMNWISEEDSVDYADKTMCLTIDELENVIYVAQSGCSDPPEQIKIYYGMMVSIVFLIITFAVYVILPDLRNLPGKCRMGYVVSLTLAYIFMTIVQMNKIRDDNACEMISYAVVYTFQAAFFWLNVMCFDIWWGLRKLTIADSRGQSHSNKFKFYSLYSWGLPFFMLIIMFLIDKDVIKVETKPNFGRSKCWFETTKASLYYLYIPLTFILVSNLIFFFLTTFTLFKQLNETEKVLKKGDSKRHQESERQKFILYTKLFIIMGISWTTELLSFLLQYWEITDLSAWNFTDIANTLQGVLIFFIFVWKKRVYYRLRKKILGIPMPNSNSGKSTSMTSNGSSAHRSTRSTTSASANIEMQPVSRKSLSHKDVRM